MEKYPDPQHSLITKVLFKILTPVNNFFDKLYHSRYNPMHRSGAIAAAMFVVLILTGFYLLFFYSVSAPYESLERIQDDVFLGKWMRSIHRYATDIAMITVVVHILQIIAQGRTWGPRFLAWVSGVFLFLVLFVSGWTGYVMIWDTHGQLLAVAGAGMLQALPFLRDVVAPAFDGSTPLPSSFFFMNLFLHVALPLGMIVFMGVHTLRLTGNLWFPIRPIFIWTVFAVFVISLVWPAPMLPTADLLSILGVVPTDLFYGFWLPIYTEYSGLAALLFWLISFAFLLSFPFWCKPSRKDQQPKSRVIDEKGCIGCNQCMYDCPFEAITMMPQENNPLSLAKVDPNFCVSCGICASACEPVVVGPPGREGSDLKERALKFVDSHQSLKNEGKTVVFAYCSRNAGVLDQVERLAETDSHLFIYPIDCSGTMHTAEIETLLGTFDGVFVWNCPVRNCVNRRGGQLLLDRIYSRRRPFLAREFSPARVHIHPASSAELSEIKTILQSFKDTLSEEDPKSIPPYVSNNARYVFTRTLASAVVLAAIGFLTAYPLGSVVDHGVLRVSAKIPGRTKTACRKLTPDEAANLPKHMQRQEVCETKSVDYSLFISVNGTERMLKDIPHGGVRGDRPLYISGEIELEPGDHQIEVRMFPNEKMEQSSELSINTSVSIRPGKVSLITNKGTESGLRLK